MNKRLKILLRVIVVAYVVALYTYAIVFTIENQGDMRVTVVGEAAETYCKSIVSCDCHDSDGVGGSE